jgi:glycosyltransferase involved in cell wall biosynthesis
VGHELTRVAHYLQRWLDLSAGFVAAQVRHSATTGVVIARDQVVNRDAFPYRPLHAMRTDSRWELAGVLLGRRIDVVHVHFGYVANDLLALPGRRPPLVLSLHGHDLTGLVTDSPHHYDRLRSAVDAVIVPSEFLAGTARAVGFPASVVHVIPSGVDTEFFTPSPVPSGPPVVAFVGRLVEKKGIDTLLTAWPQVLAGVPAARLTITGDGPLGSLLDDLDPSISWQRPDSTRRHEQVRDRLREATVVAAPSRTAADGDSESLLLVNLEAAASGRPVVTTRHGGIPEYVEDGGTGLLVEEADPAALSAALIRVLTDPALAESLGRTGRDRVADLDVRRTAGRVDELYATLT